MLNSYLAQTQALLQNPPAPVTLYSQANLTSFINTARSQLAGETACVRVMGTLNLSANVRTYGFSGIVLTSVAGAQAVFNVRQALLGVGSGLFWVRPRSFEWFTLYKLNQVVPGTGYPDTFSVYGPGSTGTLYFDPLPEQSFTTTLDCACLPSPLATDTDPEAIPQNFTDAVPFFAAFLALMGAQRYSDAQAMFGLYKTFVQRARNAVTPGVMPGNYPQTPDPFMANRLGVSPSAGGNA